MKIAGRRCVSEYSVTKAPNSFGIGGLLGAEMPTGRPACAVWHIGVISAPCREKWTFAAGLAFTPVLSPLLRWARLSPLSWCPGRIGAGGDMA